VVRGRHVFYVEGYDPQGAEGYYRLFQRLRKGIHCIWQCQANLGELTLDSDLIAHWKIEAWGPNWRVTTRYHFLRLEHMISAEMEEPTVRHVPRALGWMLDYLITGTMIRILRASWRFGLHLLYFQAVLLLWLGLAIAGGWLAADAIATIGLPQLVAVAVGVTAGVAALVILRPLAERSHAVQGNSCWPSLSKFARGQESGLDAPIEACAERLVAAVRADEADEIVVVGHSWGGAIAPTIVARALELDPDLARRGPRLVLLTLGSIMAAAALHPGAARLRAVIRRLAPERSLCWIDCQSRKDVLSCNFDPVDAIGSDLGRERCNPLPWSVRIRDMVHDDLYRRLRWNFLRIHYQYIMANDRRAPYDYFMVTCGPIPVEEWAARGHDLVAAFSPDGAYETAAVASPLPVK